jgi:hypothetical protein
MPSRALRWGILVLEMTMAGCSSFFLFPSSGPNSVSVDTKFSSVNYELVKLTPEVVKILED